MVKIRLRRTGAKKQPHYRVVVVDAKMPRDGRFLETIGHYNPRTEPPTVVIDAERALYWLSVGAQPSAAVKRLFDRENITAQVGAVRKGEVSIKDLAAEFRQAQVEEEAGVAAILEPVYRGEEEEEEAAETAPAEVQPSLGLPEAISPAEVEDLVDSDDWEEEDLPDEFDDDDDDDYEDEDDEDD